MKARTGMIAKWIGRTGYTLDIRCPECRGVHTVPLDASGHYAGPAPCKEHVYLEVQVPGEDWRALMAEEAARRVH